MATSDFEMIVTPEAAGTRVNLRGLITEKVELSADPIPAGQHVLIDVGEVTHLNSLGVRSWILFLDAVCAKSASVTLDRISPIMVFTASMISTFLSRAKVRSYESPWVCDQCDHATTLVHSVQDELPTNIACPKCKSAMEFDSDIDSYQTFKFLAQQQV